MGADIERHHFQNLWIRPWSWWRRVEDVFKTFLRRLKRNSFSSSKTSTRHFGRRKIATLHYGKTDNRFVVILIMFYITVTPKIPCIFAWSYWICAPKRRKNLENLLWLATAWNYDKNIIIVTQDLRFFFFFKIYVPARSKYMESSMIYPLTIRHII